MAKRYETLAIGQLVCDVAVDAAHVTELADSIRAQGQIAPVLVQEETKRVIDGFHRTAALDAAGFTEVDCVLVPCDEETFWDLRIASAATHKELTFQRAVEWIEEAFRLSPFVGAYKSAAAAFQNIRNGKSPNGDFSRWAEEKAAKWGVGTTTISKWLYANQSMAPELKAALPKLPDNVTTGDIVRIAQQIPKLPDLQKPLLDKVEREGLGLYAIDEVSKALRAAETPEQVQTILEEPVVRDAEQQVRTAKAAQFEDDVMKRRRDPEREDRLWNGQRRTDVTIFMLNLDSALDSVKDFRHKKAYEALTPGEREVVAEAAEKLGRELILLREDMSVAAPVVIAEVVS